MNLSFQVLFRLWISWKTYIGTRYVRSHKFMLRVQYLFHSHHFWKGRYTGQQNARRWLFLPILLKLETHFSDTIQAD